MTNYQIIFAVIFAMGIGSGVCQADIGKTVFCTFLVVSHIFFAIFTKYKQPFDLGSLMEYWIKKKKRAFYKQLIKSVMSANSIYALRDKKQYDSAIEIIEQELSFVKADLIEEGVKENKLLEKRAEIKAAKQELKELSKRGEEIAWTYTDRL